MAQTSLDTSSASQYAVLLTLTYGSTPTVVRYARWTSNIVIGAEAFTSEPSMDVVLPVQHGGTDDRAGKLTIDRTLTPFHRIGSGYKHPTVTVAVEQIDPANPSTRRMMFKGIIGAARRSPTGRSSLIQVALTGPKGRISEVKVSLPMLTTCVVPFTGLHCGVDASSWIHTGTVASVQTPRRNAVTLTLPGVSSPAAELPNGKYRRGYIEVDGLRLLIKRSRENLIFDLFDLPPIWWPGQACILHPGCDKRIKTCRQEWDNGGRFMGLGIKLPKRNPSFEEG